MSRILMLLLLLSGFAWSQVEIRIVPESLRERLSTHAITGFNIGNAMRVVGFEAEFRALRVGTLRFPPGNQADEIDVGEPDLRALATNVNLLGGARLLMVANLFSGTPDQAVRIARLAKGLDLDVFAWEIGNEPDLYGVNRNDPSWTPERYCAEFREFRSSLLEVDDGYLFAGPGVSGSRPAGERFLLDVLRLCGDVIDVLTWHIYPTDGTWETAAALETPNQFSEEFERLRRAARDAEANPLGYDREYRFAVTEFGLSWRSASFRHLEDMTAALWLADVLGRMTTERLDYSHYFALQAMGGHGLIDIGGWVRPTYHVYEMLAGFEGTPVEAQVGYPETGPGAGDLGVYAVHSVAGELQVLLVNRGSEDVAVTFNLPAGPGGEAAVRILDQVSFDEIGGPAAASIDPAGRLTLPVRSIGVARFSAERTGER